jgi:outer membrane protein OmpA-like peptidoglycan-associated protein/streptogramin lyase
VLYFIVLQGFAQQHTLQITPVSLPSQVINAVTVDAQHRIWIGTEHGLFQFIDNKFEKLTPNPQEVISISALTHDAEQNIWIGTYAGDIWKINQQKEWQKFDFQFFGSNLITSIIADEQGRIWATAYEKGIFFIDEQSEKHCFTTDNSNLLHEQTLSLAVTKNTLWIGTERGLCSLENAKKWKSYDIGGQVNAIIPHQNSLWLAMLTESGARLWQFKDYKVWIPIPLPESLEYSKITDLAFDNQGNLWITADKIGVLKNNVWQTYSQKDGFSSSSAFCLAIDEQDKVWIGTEGKGLFLFGKKDDEPKIMKEVKENKEIRLENIEKIEDKILDKPIQLKIQFEQSKAELLESSLTELDRLGKILVQNPDIQMEISGHTDNRGNVGLNQKLSEDRAKEVKNYLVSAYEIQPSRIVCIGYGGSKPIADNSNEATRSLNRRVEIRLFKK